MSHAHTHTHFYGWAGFLTQISFVPHSIHYTPMALTAMILRYLFRDHSKEKALTVPFSRGKVWSDASWSQILVARTFLQLGVRNPLQLYTICPNVGKHRFSDTSALALPPHHPWGYNQKTCDNRGHAHTHVRNTSSLDER